MTEKELLYIEDALGHSKFFGEKCDEAMGMLTDAQLKMCVSQAKEKNTKVFQSLISLL